VRVEPEVLACDGAAYPAILQELRLIDREDAGTLMVAKHIVELAGKGRAVGRGGPWSVVAVKS
jgi:hypothetical protein